jgi:hypothetical protein
MRQGSCAKTYDESIADLLYEYADLHEGPVDLDLAAGWLLAHGKWQPERRSAKRELKRLLARVAKKQKYRDPQGRVVRKLHAAKYPKVDKHGNRIFETMWDDHLKMTEAHALLSFTQRLDQIAGACKSLKDDSDSFYENNPNAGDTPIQLSFNFDTVVERTETPKVSVIPTAGIIQSPKPR